jgi:cellulose synthase/poly-beta-1,6-N-acetylglucosamine synthase-like glycosyltransferase
LTGSKADAPNLEGSETQRIMQEQQTTNAKTRTTRADDALVSLVVPVFNEEDSIERFLETVSPLLTGQNCRYELLFVDDGSHDKTLDVLRAAKTRNNNLDR